MKLKIEIVTGNAAFADGNLGLEISRILIEAADLIEGHMDPDELENDLDGKPLRDFNGNRVGKITVEN